MKPKRLLLIVYLLFLASQLEAQTIREIEFTVYGQYPVRGVEYNPVSEEAVSEGIKAAEPITIKTHSQSRMGPHKFTGVNEMIFRESDSEQIVGKVRFSEASNQWLFIFVKNPKHKEDPDGYYKYLIYAFDDSEANLPNDGLVFINISGKELDGLLENKRVTLSAGESGSFRVQESLPVNLWTREFDGEKLLPALVKTYQFQKNHRYLIIFFPPVLRGSVDLDTRFLVESTNQEEAP
ncbi:MAG: hypothetical protein AAGC73_03120 [Verrucomicrobiota bacterium]